VIRALRYAFDEAIASLWRGRHAGLLSMATIAVALFLLGAFLMVLSNIQRLASEWGESAELSVYLHDQATSADRADIERLLAPGGPVAAVEHVTKEEAVRRFRQVFSDLAPTIDGLGSNPLPESYEVRIAPQAGAAAQVEQLVQRLRDSSGVADVRYDQQWLDRLSSVISVVRTVGLIFAGLLVLAASLTVANVVRLALHARRDEVEIMQLVGAPRAYVDGPFVMEGVLQGGLGALAALAMLAAVFLLVSARYLQPLAASLHVGTFRFLPLSLCLGLLAGGMVVGCLGGAIAAAGRARQTP
jgi:cell division transport system permease protein